MIPCAQPWEAAHIGWMRAHEINTQLAEECRLNYQALIEAIQYREELQQESD